MSQKQAEILTPWAEYQYATCSTRMPLLARWLKDQNYGSKDGYIWSLTDVTDQPAENLLPIPNLLLVRMALNDKTLAVIEADPRFKIIWSE